MGMGLGRSLIASALFMGMSANAFAAPNDELQDLFNEGVKLLRQQQHAKALEKFKAILREDPAHEDAYRMWRDSEERIWIQLLAKGGEYEKVAKAFISKATLVRKQRMADAELIGGLVEKTMDSDFATRRAAIIKLAQDHGEYAIPALLEHLGNADEENHQLYAMAAINEMGPQAVLPLLAALETDNAKLRRNIVIALRRLADTRAMAELKHLAGTDSDPIVKKVAGAAITALGGTDKTAEELFVERARQFRNGRNIARFEQGDVVWHWADGKLAFRKTVKSVFPLEVARQSAYKALVANPGFDSAKVEVVLSYLGERAKVAEALARGGEDEALVELNNHLLGSDVVIAAAGLDVVRDAASHALKKGDAGLCRMAFGALAKLESADTLKGSPLVAALDNTNALICTEAAMAIAKLDPQGVAAPAGRVANLLADAANNRLVRLVQTIGLKDNGAGVTPANFKKAQMSYVNSSTGAEGALKARQAPADVFVINYNLPDLNVISVINDIKRNARSADAKIIVVAKDLKQAKTDLADKADVFLAEASVKELPARILEVLKDFNVNLGRERAVELAKAAAGSLSGLNAARYGLVALEAKLMKATTHEENAVVLGALKVLAKTGTAACVSGIAAIVTDERPLEVKVAAADTLGRIIARTGKIDQATVKGLWTVVGSDADLKLRTAVAGALGKAKLSAAKHAELLKLLRL